MSRHRPAALIGVALAALTLLASASPADARTDPAVTLARTYSPIAAMRTQSDACGPGEPYRPTVVSLVLGNNAVVLRDSEGHVVKRAPGEPLVSRRWSTSS